MDKDLKDKIDLAVAHLETGLIILRKLQLENSLKEDGPPLPDEDDCEVCGS